MLVLPVTTHATTDAWIERVLHCVHGCTAAASRRLAGVADADPAPHVAELEGLLTRARLSVAPLVHPFSPLRTRGARARQVLTLLDDCAREARALASVAADPRASHDARLSAACARVESSVHALLSPATRTSLPVLGVTADDPRHHPGAEVALHHLNGLERALAGLTESLRGSLRPPLVGS
jgi:hypothetical protein